MKLPAKSVRAGYEADNVAAARIISADPVRYPAGSLMAQWAEMLLKRNESTVTGPLFTSQRAA